MSLACSYDVPLPPNGGGAPSPTPETSCASPPSLSAPLSLSVWGLCRYWGPASAGIGGRPPSPVSGHARRACTPAKWVPPPSPPCLGVPPPLPAWHAVCEERTLIGGCPLLFHLLVGGSPPPSPASRAQGAHASWWVDPLPPLLQPPQPYLSPLCRAWGAHAAVQGSSPFPPCLGCALV